MQETSVSLELLRKARASIKVPDSETVLALGAIPDRPGSSARDFAKEKWARELLGNPPNQPPFGKGTFGIKPIHGRGGDLGERLGPTSEGLLREHPSTLLAPRILLRKDAYLELRTSYIFDGDEGATRTLHPAYLASATWGFFGIMSALCKSLKYEEQVWCFGSLLNPQGTQLWKDWPMWNTPHMQRRDYAEVTPHLELEPLRYESSAAPEATAKRLLDKFYAGYGFHEAPNIEEWP